LEDTITKAGPKPPRSDHVDFSAKQRFQVDLELGMVEEAPAGLEVHQNVDVTIRARLSAGHGSKHSDVAGAVLPSDGEDLPSRWVFSSASISIEQG
jgi:hypothetical protein